MQVASRLHAEQTQQAAAAQLRGCSRGQRTEGDAAESGHRALAVRSSAVQHGLGHHRGHAS